MLDREKYFNTILYLCWNQPEHRLVGKKKLAKLLYYVDFDRFEYKESLRTITGDSYVKFPMGPVPTQYESIVNEMAIAEKLNLGSKKFGDFYKNASVFEALCEPDISVFDEDDVFILNRVNRLYADKTGGDLEQLSHSEAPWHMSDLRERIIFETALCRGTNFGN